MAFDNIKDLVDEYTTAKAKFEETMKKSFGELFKEFFTLYPEVKAVGWNQYTPYFNDGETCEFSRNEIHITTEEVPDDLTSAYQLEEMGFAFAKPNEYDYKLRTSYPRYETKIQNYEKACEANPRFKEVCEGCAEFISLLTDIPDDIYLSVFGDHSFVLATPDGINVSEYDHE